MHPPALSNWLEPLELYTGSQEAVLNFLSIELGATQVGELVSLSPADVATAISKVPKLKRKAFERLLLDTMAASALPEMRRAADEERVVEEMSGAEVRKAAEVRNTAGEWEVAALVSAEARAAVTLKVTPIEALALTLTLTFFSVWALLILAPPL